MECREQHGFATFREACALSELHPPCPGYGSSMPPGTVGIGGGAHPAGGRCRDLSGTVFEGARHPLADWAECIELTVNNVQDYRAADLVGVFTRLRSNGVIACSLPWTVAGYPLSYTTASRSMGHVTDALLMDDSGQRPRRGLSRNMLYIAVAIGVRKNMVAVSGHGKPCSARIKWVLASLIVEGPVIFHGMERSRAALVEAVGECRRGVQG